MSKKIINDPANVVEELLEGLIAAGNGSIRQVGAVGALAKANLQNDKVGILIGGGSGHEPLFPCFIGDNLADGAACGNVFAAPPPDVILDVTRALNKGKGVLYVYGNYAGDCMNFDIAAEMAEEEGIDVKTVRVWDDVASAPPDQTEERRGIAGDLFVIKIAGAAATKAPDLDEVFRITSKARDCTRSIGVALAAGSIPETGEPTFKLGDDEMEIGMGLHGEPGVRRQKLEAADAIVTDMMGCMLDDMPLTASDDVCLLVNNLGSTTFMELLIVNRRARQILDEKDISVHDTVMGSFCTCQEMAGASITLMKLDPELRQFYDMPARSPAFTKG